MRRTLSWMALAGLVVNFGLASTPLQSFAAGDESTQQFHFVAFGDMPYSVPADIGAFETLLAGINDSEPVFVVHVGDIKSGISQCSDKRYEMIRGYFDTIDSPLIYTPGDNDWADCDRILAGGHDTRERLAELRRVFFPEAQSLGRNPMPLLRQADLGAYPDMVENAIWHHGGITFATLHLVGSDNNLFDDPSEFEARNSANLDWIATALRAASERGSIGAVLLFHADIFSRRAPAVAFAGTVAAIAATAEAFGRPILLVNGDAHVFGIDTPVRRSDTGRTNSRITRVIVSGGSDIRAVKVTIDPNSPALFSAEPLALRN